MFCSVFAEGRLFLDIFEIGKRYPARIVCLSLPSSVPRGPGSKFSFQRESWASVMFLTALPADSAHLLPRMPDPQCSVCCARSQTVQASFGEATEVVKQLLTLPAGLRAKHPAKWRNEMLKASLFQVRMFYLQNIQVFFSSLFPVPIYFPLSCLPSFPASHPPALPLPPLFTLHFLLFLLLKNSLSL